MAARPLRGTTVDRGHRPAILGCLFAAVATDRFTRVPERPHHPGARCALDPHVRPGPAQLGLQPSPSSSITFLSALALGSLAAHRLIEARRDPGRRAHSPPGRRSDPGRDLALGHSSRSPADFWLCRRPRRLGSLSGDAVFALAAVVILPPTLLLGTDLPLPDAKLGEAHSRSAGRTLGQLVAINTLGGILGLAPGEVLACSPGSVSGPACDWWRF
mgnify:CR=1 FL=1